MRLTIGVAAAALLCLLGGGVIASTMVAQPAVNGTVAASDEPVATMNNSADAIDRAGEIHACVSGAPRHLPDGTDATRFCTCAVDRMITNGVTQRDAVNQCATEMHITVTNG